MSSEWRFEKFGWEARLSDCQRPPDARQAAPTRRKMKIAKYGKLTKL